MDAALGHLVFSMKYDVIGDQEHLRLMLRYSFLLSLSLTCFLHHLWFLFSWIFFYNHSPWLHSPTPPPLTFISFCLFIFLFLTYFLSSLPFLTPNLQQCNNPPFLFSLHVLTVSKIHPLSTEYFFLYASLDTFSFCSKITLNQGKMSQSKVAFSVPPIQSVVLTGCLSYAF